MGNCKKRIIKSRVIYRSVMSGKILIKKLKSEDIRSKNLILENLVKYQKDAIVSKTIIDKKTGTVTLFAFDKGQGLSEHTAPYDATVYIIDGEAKIVIAGKVIKVKRGGMVVMPANKPHSLSAIKKFKMLLIMIRS